MKKSIIYSSWLLGRKNEVTSSLENNILCPLCNERIQLISRLTSRHFIRDAYSNLSRIKNSICCYKANLSHDKLQLRYY